MTQPALTQPTLTQPGRQKRDRRSPRRAEVRLPEELGAARLSALVPNYATAWQMDHLTT